MNRAFAVINETVGKSMIRDLRDFLKRYQNIDKWYVCSDYCIDDPKKSNNVISFVIFPHNISVKQRMNQIHRLQPFDLKKTSQINPMFCEYLHSGTFFSINFLLAQDNFFDCWKDKDTQINFVERYIEMTKQWQITTPNNAEMYAKYMNRLQKFRTGMNQKSFNCKLMARVMTITFLAGYIKYLLLNEHKNVSLYSWLSDRDDITTWGDGIYEIFYHITSHNICHNNLSDPTIEAKMNEAFVLADGSKQFYDPLNRIADYICGVVADYNYYDNTVSKEKQFILIEDAIADNQYIANLLISPQGVSRITYHRS